MEKMLELLKIAETNFDQVAVSAQPLVKLASDKLRQFANGDRNVGIHRVQALIHSANNMMDRASRARYESFWHYCKPELYFDPKAHAAYHDAFGQAFRDEVKNSRGDFYEDRVIVLT